MLIRVYSGHLDGPRYFIAHGKRVAYEDIYNGPRRRELYDEKGEWRGFEYLPPSDNTFNEYLREHPGDVLYKYDMGEYTFSRAVGAEIETVGVVPPPARPWHNNGPPVTNLEKVPFWALVALKKLGEVLVEEDENA